MTFTSDTLEKQFASMKDNPIAQDMMLMQMYRVNGLFANILGTAVGGAYSALYMAIDNSHGVDGLDSFKKVMSKDYAGLTKEMDQLEKAFAGNSKFKPEFAQAIRAELAMVKQNWLLIALAEE